MSRVTPERAEQLVVYVQESIQKLDTGEIIRLPTYQELADKFGYTRPKSLYYFLRSRDINLKKYEQTFRLPKPSPDLGWLLGILSAGGFVDPIAGNIELTNAHESVAEKYRLIGERLFFLNAYRKSREAKLNQGTLGYSFYSVKVAEFLGDLRRDAWAKTILSVHPWVVDNSRYTWGFINGFFEERGGVYVYDNRWSHRIALFTPSQSGASLLAEMLVRQGLKHPVVEYAFRPVEQVRGVEITNLRDIRAFAQHTHSEIPEKEVVLEYYRTRFSLDGGRPAVYTRERLIEEWKNINKELGRSPNTGDINVLRRKGKTDIRYEVYARNFGQGSFVRAREELERIIREGEERH